MSTTFALVGQPAAWMVILAVLAALYAFARFLEWRSIYQPARRMVQTPADAGLEYEEVHFVAEDGAKLHGWWIPAEGAPGTLLYCHGNAGNLSDRTGITSDLHRLGLHLFIFDYRGYGKSRGLPTERRMYRDARAAYEVVRNRYNDTEEPPVLLYGSSLGAAVAIQLAGERPVRGLIIESAFTSIADMAAVVYPWIPARKLIYFQYKSIDKITRLFMPKLISHSPDDDVIPYAFGRRLYEAAPEPKAFVTLNGGHSESGWQTCPAYWSALKAFVEETMEA